MPPFDAFHLPGVAPGAVAETLQAAAETLLAPSETLQAGRLECRYPRPDAALLDPLLDHLIEAGRALTRRSVASIIDGIDAAAGRLADPADPLRREAEALLPEATGFSAPMTRLVLDRMIHDWRAPQLHALVEAELGGPAALDGFAAAVAPDPGHAGSLPGSPPAATTGSARRVTRAYGPRLLVHIFAGNVPGVAVTSLVRGLLVKAPSLGKLASGEPVLPVLFARALADVDPALAAALAVTYWPGGSAAVEERALAAADTIVVYGGGEAVDSLRRRVPPEARLLVHGPRLSIGLVGSDALDEPLQPLARRIALAVATFDQQGCVSPHSVWVETDGHPGGGRAPALAEAVAREMDTLEHALPRGRIGAAEASAIQQARGAAEMRAHGGEAVRVLADEGTAWTVVYDPVPDFRPSCLNRFLRIHPIPALEDAPRVLAEVGTHLQSVAIEGAGPRLPRLAHELARIGASRVTSFDALPWPPAHWNHDGRGPLRELLRWVDLET